NKCPVAKENIIAKRGIEVGQVFNFGLKYSKAMEASVMSASGEKIYPNMGSYGIGVSRVVAGAIEANHDERGIIWPAQIAPFDVMVINIKTGDEQCDLACAKIYENLQKHNIEVLYDDTKNSMGQKLAIADLIGVPYQIIVGPKTLANNQVEIKNRKSGEKTEICLNKI
ncbi:MAG: His/Gly/Thr/Pro-type tRNA ligase C-terminal domain-containing protein, partial [Rickettsiales bacterium]